jgi:hypothetical protein
MRVYAIRFKTTIYLTEHVEASSAHSAVAKARKFLGNPPQYEGIPIENWEVSEITDLGTPKKVRDVKEE